MIGIRDALSELGIKAKAAVLFRGATDSKIDFANAMLRNEGLAPMPYDYAEFLRETNGLIAPGIEFYGTDEIERTKERYRFPNLLGANNELAKGGNQLIKGSVLVGNAFLWALIYDPADEAYRIASRPGFATMRKCADISEVLRHILALM